MCGALHFDRRQVLRLPGVVEVEQQLGVQAPGEVRVGGIVGAHRGLKLSYPSGQRWKHRPASSRPERLAGSVSWPPITSQPPGRSRAESRRRTSRRRGSSK